MLSGSDEDYNCPLSLILDELYFHVQFLTALHYGEHLASDLPFKKANTKSHVYTIMRKLQAYVHTYFMSVDGTTAPLQVRREELVLL